MAIPTGDWAINANGWHGTLHLNDDGDGSVSGTIDFGTGPEPVKGAWDESAQQLIFPKQWCSKLHRLLIENTGNMFMGQGGPSGPPNWHVLAGNFDDVRSTHPFGRAHFGWAARQAVS